MINIGMTLISIGGVGAVFAALNLHSKNNRLKHMMDLKDHDLDEARRYSAVKREKNQQLSKLLELEVKQKEEYCNKVIDLQREVDYFKSKLWDCKEGEKQLIVSMIQKQDEVAALKNEIEGLQKALEAEKERGDKVSKLEDQNDKLAETLQGILSMNREDRRMFAKSGLIPAELIKIDMDMEV